VLDSNFVVKVAEWRFLLYGYSKVDAYILCLILLCPFLFRRKKEQRLKRSWKRMQNVRRRN
jgi:hypothetical protein